MSNSPNSGDVAIKNFVDSVKSSYPTFMSLNWEKDKLLDNYNYILTEKAKERLDKLYTYISNGIPVLLEGETGTSKTLSSEIICKYIYEMKNQGNPDKKDTGESFIKFNLSAEVKINDLMQKFMGNKSSLSGLEIVDGPFLKAFKGGIPLILDEINLAPEEVLQCIEEALDSGEINMEISGIGNIHCKKKEGFCLIATQNPNRDNYMNKRQNLSKSFLSHFQIIKFPPFEIEELEEIAKKLFKSFNNNKEGNENDNKFISDLISFHKAWTSQDERKEEIACFTIREIAATVKAYIDEGKKNPFQIIKVIYASRYQSDVKQKLLKFLGSFDSFKKEYEDNSGSKYKIPKTMKGFYENDILKDVLESSLFSLEKRRNIIIVGEFGIGKSHIAREIAKIFNSKNGKEESSFYHFICTEETKCSDLIGGQTPEGSEGKNIYMEWKDGFLTKAIEKGEIVIMDNLQEANSTITERLNGLLDIKYDEGKKKGEAKKFDIPENPLKNSIEIHKDFRIIGICDNQSINQMSPAFLNRFDIIILENQLKNISNEALINLLQIIINRREEKSTVDMKSASIKDMFKSLIQNDQAMTVVIAIVMINTALYFTQQLVYFFLKYDFSPATYRDDFTLFNTVGGGCQILAMMLLFPILRKFMDTVKIFYTCFGMAVFGYILIIIIALSGTGKITWLLIPAALIMAAVGVLNVIITVFLANTVDYGEWKNYRRDESVIFSMQTFVVKLASGISGFMSSMVLAIFSINPDKEATVVKAISTSQRFGLRFTMTLIPIAVLTVGAVVFNKRYILFDTKMDEITEEIEGRKATS